MGIGLITLLMTASATETPWYQGATVGAVSIVNQEGYVPEGDLQDLLSIQVGEPFTSEHVRQDLSTLYTMGEYASISVDLLNDSIDDTPFLHVRYQIDVAPRLSKVVLDVDDRTLKRTLADIVPYSLGQVFYPTVELWRLEKLLRRRLEGLGYINLNLRLDYDQLSGKQIILRIVVESATVNRYASVTTSNLPRLVETKVQRILKKHNIQTNQRVQVGRLKDVQLDIESILQQAGWLDAKVRLLLQQAPNNTQELHILVESNKRTRVFLRTFNGTWRLKRQLQHESWMLDTLNIYSGVWLSNNDIPRLTESLLNWLDTQGYWDATVQIAIAETTREHQVFVDLSTGPRHQITTIRFQEGSVFSDAELLSTFLYERPQLAPNIVLNGIYDRSLMAIGIEDLKEAFVARGYVNATVEVKEDITPQPSVVLHAITINIDPKEQFEIGTVEVNGGIESVNASLTQDLKGTYTPQRLDSIKRNLESTYQESGFLYATVDMDTTIRGQNIVDVTYSIVLGEVVLLRNIGVRGNQLTRRDVIEDALHLESGTPLTPSMLEGVRYDLNALELFESTSVRLYGDTVGQQDLFITVKERPQWALRTGGSVASDLGALAIGSVHNRNIGGKGRQASVLGQFGYAWAEDAWQFDSTEPIWRLASTYIAPRTPISLSNIRLESIFQEIVQQPNYRMVQSGMGLGLGVNPTSDINILVEYRLKRMVLDDVEPSLLLLGEPWTMLGDESPTRWWSGVQGSMVLDFRNDPFNPTQGVLLSGDVKVGDGILNQLPTVRLTGGMTTLIPTEYFRWRVALGWGIGRTNDDSPLPLEDRFFLGGANSMRGFARNQVGPANQRPWSDFEYPDQIDSLIDEYFREDASSRWTATGGDYFALANVELHYPLTRWDMAESSLVTFVDVGHVDFISRQSFTTSTDSQLDPLFRYSVGVGLRYSTVIGPIALDLGVNPSPMFERGEVWVVPNLSFGSL